MFTRSNNRIRCYGGRTSLSLLRCNQLEMENKFWAWQANSLEPSLLLIILHPLLRFEKSPSSVIRNSITPSRKHFIVYHRSLYNHDANPFPVNFLWFNCTVSGIKRLEIEGKRRREREKAVNIFMMNFMELFFDSYCSAFYSVGITWFRAVCKTIKAKGNFLKLIMGCLFILSLQRRIFLHFQGLPNMKA